MSFLTKFKIAVILGSALALFFCSDQIKSTYSYPTREKYWTPDSTLNYSDFLQYPPILEFEFGATIFSFMRLTKFADGSYKAFTVIDRYKSWYDESSYTQDGLRHERYHANLTASGTNKLNSKIKMDSVSYEEAVDLLHEISTEVRQLQDQYDSETDHSLISSMQDYWEYKIDSLYYLNDQIESSDLFSGISCYFPAPPTVHIEKDTFYLSKQLSLEAYRMGFRLLTEYDSSIDTTNSKNGYLDQLKTLGYIDYSVQTGEWENLYSIDIQYTDTVTNERFHDRLIVDGSYMYQLTVYHPSIASEDALYTRMKDQFLNSFSQQSFASLWIKEISKKESKELHDVTPQSDEIMGEYYTSLSYSDNSLIYHKPFVYDDKLIIVFQPQRHSIEDVDVVMIHLNDKVFAQEPDSSYQAISIDLNLLNKNANRLQFGYLAKSDSIRKAPHFYSTVIKDYSVSKKMQN